MVSGGGLDLPDLAKQVVVKMIVMKDTNYTCTDILAKKINEFKLYHHGSSRFPIFILKNPMNYLYCLQMARSKILHNTQVLTTRVAFRVKVGDFTNTDSSVPTACSKAFVVSCCGVEDTTIVPNG